LETHAPHSCVMQCHFGHMHADMDSGAIWCGIVQWTHI